MFNTTRSPSHDGMPPGPLRIGKQPEAKSAMAWNAYSEEDKAVLHKSWLLLEPKKQQLGCGIYDMIFNQCPEARKLFPKMKFTGNKREKKSCEFVFQALRFIQVIEGGVMALDDLSSLSIILDNLGRRHGKLEINGKFRAVYWSVFLESCLFNIRRFLEETKKMSADEVDAAIIAFRLLLTDIIAKIKVGYSTDIAHRLKQMSMDATSQMTINLSDE